MTGAEGTTGGPDDAHLIDLASRALGGSVLVANDETYDEATERDAVRGQLAEITSLRLRRLWGEGEA